MPIAATDGKIIFLNPAEFCKHSVAERVFIIAHEVMHGVFDHCGLTYRLSQSKRVSYADGKVLPWSADAMNMAEDYVINAMLIHGGVGAYNKNWLYRDDLSEQGDESAIDIYRKLWEEAGKPKGEASSGNSPGKGGQPGKGGGQQSFDQHLDPGAGKGQEPFSADQARDSHQWRQSVAQAAQAARTMGKLPAGFERVIGDILEPPVDWKEHIQGFLARTLGNGGYDWSRLDRRFVVRAPDPIGVPSRSGFGCGTVVVGVDTSGSIGEKQLALFFGCMSGILSDVRPRRLVVMWCDAKVHRVDEVESAEDMDELRHRGAPGGGGTSFVPVFDEIASMGLEPEALVYLTDMLGTFPAKAPSYPVLWAKIYDAPAPWGDELRLPDDVFK